MKAVTFQQRETVSVDSVPDAEIEKPGDVILRTRLTAICGSDLHVYHQRETGIEPGTIMGHEFLGEIVAVGADVKALKPGDSVVAPFTTNCGDCFYCRKGLTCRCSRGQLFGWVEKGLGLQGAQAEYVRVPMAESTLVRLPEGIDEETALLTGDILSTGFFCAEMAGIEPEGVYGVVGCGPVGLLAILAARELGAETLFAFDSIPERLELAARFGAQPIDIETDAPVALVKESTDGRGLDGVMELVGSPEATRLAVDLLAPGGVLSAVGVHTEPQFAFSPAEAYDKNLTYRAGRCPARHYMPRLLRLVADKRYDFGAIFSHRLELGEAARGYDIFTRKLEGCTKVVLRP